MEPGRNVTLESDTEHKSHACVLLRLVYLAARGEWSVYTMKGKNVMYY